MPIDNKNDKKRAPRRTNDELTHAIFTATIAILEADGYEKVTFANVAVHAETARTVLYKRWDSPFTMLFDAVQYFSHVDGENVPDVDFTGHTMRENLIRNLNHFNVSSQFMRALAYELSKNSPAVNQIFTDMRNQELFLMEGLLHQAQLTGEINHSVTDYVKFMPFDLLLYQSIVSQTPLTAEFRVELIDTVVIPAILAQQT